MKYYKTNNSVVFTKNNKYVVLTKTKNGIKITNVSDEDVDWITVRGNHIPVKKGQSKEEAVKSFIDGKRGSGKGKYPFGEVDKVLYPGDKEKQKKNKQDFKKRQAESEKEDAEKFEKAKRREKKAPPKVGTLDFGNEIRRYFDYDKIPKQNQEKAFDIYRKYQDVYHMIYEKGMNKIQENLDKLSVDYGDRIANLVGEKNSTAREKTDRMDNPPEQVETGFFDSIFKSRYGRVPEDKKEKAKEIYSEFKKEYSNMYEIGMGKIHTLLDKVNSSYGEKLHRLEENKKESGIGLDKESSKKEVKKSRYDYVSLRKIYRNAYEDGKDDADYGKSVSEEEVKKNVPFADDKIAMSVYMKAYRDGQDDYESTTYREEDEIEEMSIKAISSSEDG